MGIGKSILIGSEAGYLGTLVVRTREESKVWEICRKYIFQTKKK